MPDTRTYWEASTPPLPHIPSLDKDLTTEVVVIGAGYTGLNAALELAERGVDAVAIDAKKIGDGASGRSGGFIAGRFRMQPAKVLARHGSDMVDLMQRISVEASQQVEANVDQYQLHHALLKRHGLIRGAVNMRHLDALRKGFGEVKTDFGDASRMRLLGAKEITELTGSHRFVGGTLTPNVSGLHPLGYVRGLAEACRMRGVSLFAETRATKIVAGGRGVRVETAGGIITAKQVILATNGYSDLNHSVPEMAQRILPFRSAAIATAPLPADAASRILPERQMMVDTKRLLRWYRIMEDRLVIGGRGSGTSSRDNRAYQELAATIAEVFPALSSIPIDFSWSGYVGMTMDQIPHVGRLSEQVIVAGGYNGNGVAFGSLFGRYAARIAVGDKIETGIVGTDHFRRVPLRRLSQPAIRMVVRWYQLLDAIGA